MIFPIELAAALHELVGRGLLSSYEHSEILKRLGRNEALEVTDELRRQGRITFKQFDGIMRAIDRDRTAQAKARRKEVFRSIDQKHSHGGSPVVQGGLPSLGKRRP
jgi:hypothetical protein